MGFFQAIKSCFGNYVGFTGRARRSEYWNWVLFNILVTTTLLILIGVSETGEVLGLSILLSVIWLLVTIIPSIAVTVRRLQDTGKSALYLLLWLVPLIGSLILFIFMLTDSEGRKNKYGLNPKRN